MNGVQTRFKCKLDVKRCKRFVFPPSSLLPRSNALKTKAIRYFQTDRTLTRIVSPPLYGDSTSMVVHGISMGAATTMMVSGEPQPDYVKCFVEDCGYTSVWDQFSKELKAQFGLPQFPLMYTADWLCQLEYGWGFKEASALKQVARCHLPMFFIHGDKDDYVPTWMVYKLYEAKPQPKALWIVPEADHAHSYLFNTEEYTQKVKAFVDKYIQ